jgi:hypothetical protein
VEVATTQVLDHLAGLDAGEAADLGGDGADEVGRVVRVHVVLEHAPLRDHERLVGEVL